MPCTCSTNHLTGEHYVGKYCHEHNLSPGIALDSDPVEDGCGCTLAGPNRGDCEHFVGIPSPFHKPRQHDGDNDTVDCYGKPNGWCWSCWKSYKIEMYRGLLVEAMDGTDEHYDNCFRLTPRIKSALRL